MQKIKKLGEFSPINEAREWPTGSIAKVDTKLNLGKYSYGWTTFEPKQASGAKDGCFYFEVEKSGRMWLEGKILAGNCLSNIDFTKVRVSKNDAQPAGPEYKYFKDADIFNKRIIGKALFMDGKELGMLNMEGDEAKNVTEGEYSVVGYNFYLTAKMKEVVVFIKAKGRDVTFNAPLSIVEGYSKELSKEQREVIAEWFAKQLGGADINVRDDQFQIKRWKIIAPQTKGYPSSFNAGPFVTEKQAKDVLDAITKMNEYSLFEPSAAKIDTDWSTMNFGLDALIDWAKTVGVKTTMKELLELRKGAVSAKKFGI